MRRCLSDEELIEVCLDGPDELAVHSDGLAHQHIIHDQCLNCNDRLVDMIMLYVVADDMVIN